MYLGFPLFGCFFFGGAGGVLESLIERFCRRLVTWKWDFFYIWTGGLGWIGILLFWATGDGDSLGNNRLYGQSNLEQVRYVWDYRFGLHEIYCKFVPRFHQFTKMGVGNGLKAGFGRTFGCLQHPFHMAFPLLCRLPFIPMGMVAFVLPHPSFT